SIGESLSDQGDQLGTAHPNFTGQSNYRGHLNTSVIQHTPPVTTPSAMAGGQPYVFGTWTASDVTVILSAVNPIQQSGVGHTYFAVDNPACDARADAIAQCSLYTAPFLITSGGEHTVTFFSNNQFGAFEKRNTVVVKIDRVP